ncbi:Uncharacterised protein [Vibrio cholerae]|nr:Uncharacterised protein [Vibrio cholerae]
MPSCFIDIKSCVMFSTEFDRFNKPISSQCLCIPLCLLRTKARYRFCLI